MRYVKVIQYIFISVVEHVLKENESIYIHHSIQTPNSRRSSSKISIATPKLIIYTMEEKRKDVGTPPPLATYISESPAATEANTGGSRRRGGGQKRKASSGIGSGGSSNSTPPTTSSSKRQAREKVPLVPFTPIHNGPLTRARQQPNNSFAGPAVDVSSASVLKIEGELRGREAAAAKEEELIKEAAEEDWEALEAKIEAEYEGIRSRDDNVHVVPNHAGWFSWTKIHPLEEKILPSFFNGKSESRNPEVYMEIRNCIMTKFHANPSIQIELKDLSVMSVGEMEARQEVMEFLDYWGLINYHPFLKTDMPGMSIEGDADTAVKTESLVKTLFHFESDSPCMPVVLRKSIATPAAPPGFFPESAIAEELIKSEEPPVEYHCNSCSADCSRKRYHCQKQADFDLCTECFNNGKLGSDMSPSDFILMEPAEAGGASSGNWTDQETLLLLEALELFKENWSEIAEHVATKTKAQCILHFVQMPIEDTFLDSDEEIVGAGKENEDAVQINSESSAPKYAAENAESKGNADDNQTSSSPTENSKPVEVDVSNVCKVGENFVMKALTEAFEAVGPRPSPGERLSFAEAGNPVMTLAAFLLRLVEPNIVTASARSSLKSIHGNSSGDQLAARHCFCLEDSPDEKKSRNSERIVSEMAEEQTQNDEERNVEGQEEKFNSAVDGIHASHDEGYESIKDHAMDEEKPVVSASNAYVDESASTKEANVTRIHEEPEPSNAKEQDDADFPKEPEPAISKKSDDSNMEVEVPPGFEKEPEAGAKAAKPSKSAEVPNAKDPMPSLEDKIPVQSTTSNSVDESSAKEGAEPKDSRNREKEGLMSGNDLEDNKIKKAAVTAISAAAVKAKLLASQEEKQIQQLAALLIEKQLQKLEFKLAFFNDMENVVMRVREQLERSKQRLFHERAQIIAARLGMSGPRPMQSSSVNRAAMAFANAAPRPIIGMSTQRPPISRHAMAPTPASTSVAGTPMQSSGRDQLS